MKNKSGKWHGKLILYLLQVTQLCNNLDTLLDKEILDTDVMEAYFLQALTWSLGGSLQEDSRIKFDQFVKYLASMPTNDDDDKLVGAGVFCTFLAFKSWSLNALKNSDLNKLKILELKKKRLMRCKQSFFITNLRMEQALGWNKTSNTVYSRVLVGLCNFLLPNFIRVLLFLVCKSSRFLQHFGHMDVGSLETYLKPSVIILIGEMPVGQPTLYEYFWDGEEKKWVPWSQKVPEYVHNSEVRFNDILVPTVDTVRTMWLLSLQVKIKRPVLLVGETGTSKTATASNFLRQLDSEHSVSIYLFI